MDITITNQSGVRKNFYEFPSDVAAALIHAGLAFHIVKAAPVPVVEAHWYVCEKPVQSNQTWNDDYLLAWTDGRGAVMYYTGSPEAYLKKPPVYCGLECPLSVLEQYARVQGVKVDPDWYHEQMQRQKDAAATHQQRENAVTAQYTRG